MEFANAERYFGHPVSGGLGWGLPMALGVQLADRERSEEHTSELQSLMRISYAVFCLKKKKYQNHNCPFTPHTNSQPTNHRHPIPQHTSLIDNHPILTNH